MQFESNIPEESDESVYYAEEVTIDSCGIDLVVYGEKYSASFEDIDCVDVALAILEDDFDTETASQVGLIERIGGLGVDAMERMGYSYLKASQNLRENLLAEVKTVELVA